MSDVLQPQAELIRPEVRQRRVRPFFAEDRVRDGGALAGGARPVLDAEGPAEQRVPRLGDVTCGEDARERRAAARVRRDAVRPRRCHRVRGDSDRDDDHVGVELAAHDRRAEAQLHAGLGVALRQERADLTAEHALERCPRHVDERHRRAERDGRGGDLGADEARTDHGNACARPQLRPQRRRIRERPQHVHSRAAPAREHSRRRSRGEHERVPWKLLAAVGGRRARAVVDRDDPP